MEEWIEGNGGKVWERGRIEKRVWRVGKGWEGWREELVFGEGERLKLVDVEEGMRRKGEGKGCRGWKEGKEWDQ